MTESNVFDDAESPKQLMGLLAGAVSVCWERIDRAANFVKQAEEKLDELLGVK